MKQIVIGVIADTHGLIRPELLEQFKGVDCIVHAGDIGSPHVLDVLREIAPVHAVRGNADKGDWAASLPMFDLFEMAGHFIYLIHDLKTVDFDPAAAGIHVIISGHSHQPDISYKKGIFYLNPGSAGPRRFKLPVSASLLRLECGAHINAELITMRFFIEQATWKDGYRLIVRFDNGVTKTVNLEPDEAYLNFKSLLDPEYLKQFAIDPHKGALIWPNGERYTADKLYETGIRCRIDFDEPTVEWYLSRFDDHLDGVEVLFGKSCELKSDAYTVPLFILFSQNGRLYKIVDEIIDWCDPACGAGWEQIRRETSKEELLHAIDHEGLGVIEGEDCFGTELRSFLEHGGK